MSRQVANLPDIVAGDIDDGEEVFIDLVVESLCGGAFVDVLCFVLG